MSEPVKTEWAPSGDNYEATPPRDTPDAWIVSLIDGMPALGNELDDPKRPPKPLTDGQVVLFNAFKDYGRAMLTIRSEDDWDVDWDMPREAALVGLADEFEDMGGRSVGRLVDDLLNAGCEPGSYPVIYYSWEHDIPHRFDMAARAFRPEPRP